MINERCISIIMLLLKQDSFLTITEIAKKMNVSARTIRYDLDMIENWFYTLDNVKLIRTPKLGIAVNDPENKIQKNILNVYNYDYRSNSKERVRAIVCLLLSESNKLNLKSISNKLNISISTVSNDLKYVRQWLEEHSLNLISKPHLGIYIDSDERAIHKGVYMMLREILDVHNNKINIIKNSFTVVKEACEKYLMNDIAETADKWSDTIVKCIKSNYSSDKYIVSDTGFCDLYIFLMVTITRHYKSDQLKLNKWEEDFILSRREQVDDEGFISCIKKYIGIDLNYYERLLLDGQLLSTKAYIFDKNEAFLLEDILIAQKLINSIKPELNVDFEVDKSTIKEMAFHINALFYRLILGIPCGKNNLIDEIKTSFKDVFAAVDKNIRVIVSEKIPNIIISEDEIAYITMYVISAFFKSSINVEEKKNVIIICGSNVATSEILKNRLTMLFSNINVIKSMPYSEFLDCKEKLHCDLILSTFPMESEDYRCITVNPLLSEEDIQNLATIFTLKLKSIDINKYISATINIIKNTINISPDDELKLSLALTQTLSKEMDSLKYSKMPHIRDVLREEYVDARVKAKNWQDAIQQAGNLLINKNKIKQENIDEMIKIKKKLGPYFVVKGVALPHLTISQLRKPYISIITLNKPVKFGHKYNDPVNIIIMLISNNDSTHLGIIEDIIDILNDQKKVQDIQSAENKNELIKAVL